MAEITARRSGELVRGVFEILLSSSEGIQAREVLARLAQSVPPTDFEQSTYPKSPTVRRYEKIVRFATIAPVKAAWLVKEKGTWTLTEDGEKAFREFKDPENFMREANRLYKVWKDQQPDEEESDDAGPDAHATVEEAEEAAWSSIKDYLLDMNPFDFQNLVAGLLRAMGYHVSYVSPPGPDRGIDILAHTDPLGIEGPRIKVQVKRRSKQKTDVDGVRSFFGVLGSGEAGIYVCTSGFTSTAESEARAEKMRKVMLIDLERLFDLWVEHYAELEESVKNLLPLKPVYYLAPTN